MRTPTRLCLAAVLAVLIFAACDRPFQERYRPLLAELERVRDRGGQWCSPRDFASAEAYLFLAKNEWQAGNRLQAENYLDYVKGHVSSALDKTSECTSDLDHDGLIDMEDGDPYRAEDYDGWQDGNGIPDPDNDGDGFLDAEDACPTTPEDFDSWQDSDGCPDIDNDEDTIPDGRDDCTMAPEDLDGWEDMDGCPDPDNDFDGLRDEVDACPNAAENFNEFLDDDGCPDFVPKKHKIIRTPKISFVGNTLTLTKASVRGLQKFANLCGKNPEMYIRIEGYTDRSGDPVKLVNRTKERAEVVKQVLAEFEVGEDRMITFGFGRPESRTRRSGYWVDFVIYQR
jgi:outer membrane protein OmpA-like peptidoglycan-associated protein